MSTNKTDNYHLHLWEKEDEFHREEFNDNFTKVDAVVRAAETKAAGALAEGLSAQTAALSAYQTANDAAVGALAAAMPRMAVGSYVGTGGYGAGSPNTLTFDFAPKMVLVMGFNHDNTSSYCPGFAVLLSGVPMCTAFFAQNPGSSDAKYSGTLVTTFSGNTVSFYSEFQYTQMNYMGLTYHYIAFG